MIEDTTPLAAHHRWVDALVRRDTATLDTLLSPSLRYTHSIGLVHDRASYLDFVRTGPRFLSVGLDEIELRSFGDVALLSGVLRLVLQPAGAIEPRHVASIAVQVWRRQEDRWQLELAQATSVPVASEPA